MSNAPWWQGAIIYQIYPRSFFDSNSDGIGDLKGINQKLSYIADLGVDAIWISPFFKSPMADFGYDIADYRQVDPLFGSLADFEQLIGHAHDLGLKVMIDQVLSHTSDQHAWFQQSRQNQSNDKADWYVWADGVDGQPPNNWLSIFGGSAWEWDEQREQYYLHNFLSSQPDLNYHCPALREAILQEVEFWLDKGVDGFRFDAINFCYHDAELRDNPYKPVEARKARGFSKDNPYAAQYHIYDNNRPEMLIFLQQLRALLDRFGDIASVGEINTEDSLQTISEYTSDQRLNLGYSFELLADEQGPTHIKSTVEGLEQKLGSGMGCWSLSNHDVVRVASRWGDKTGNPEFAKLLNVMLCSLRGAICMYQGEELGLTEAELCYEQLQDPFGKRFWPDFKGRDGCRTPFPWNSGAKHAGFSCADTSWLPVSNAHTKQAVNLQSENSGSVLAATKSFLKWRNGREELRYGEIEFKHADEQVLVFERYWQSASMLCAFNFSGEDIRYVSDKKVLEQYSIPGLRSGCSENSELFLPAYGTFFAHIESDS